MKKNELLLILALCFSIPIYSQLKVDPNGRIGIGTSWPNPEFKCHIKGDLLLTDYPNSPYYELRMKVGNGFPGVDIGSSSDKIAFWASWVGYNELLASDFSIQSDSTLKMNIKPIRDARFKIMRLGSYHYQEKDNKYGENMRPVSGTKSKYGFISQEVEELFPEVDITTDAKGVKLMDYNQILPIVVAASQEQEIELQQLKSRIVQLENLLAEIVESEEFEKSFGKKVGGVLNKSILYQNRPNPFSQSTIIQFDYSDQEFSSGEIQIFNLNGTLVDSYAIEKGIKEIIVPASTLNSGEYIYSLILNNEQVDSKRMILLK